ncbi:MAG: C4-dicarboxylate ABC transporter [Rhodospirillaceae bacterium]|nr:C4-dicarboxylate ABC transporter [Rhodospirillaceae bacterium]
MDKTFLKTAAFAAVASALVFGAATDSDAKVKWKMQAAFGSQVSHLGPAGQRIAEFVTTMSKGNFTLKFFEPGALIPPLECFDAVSKGSVESCYTTPGYHTGKYPGLAFMTAVPFGPQYGEFLAWQWYGGGQEIADRIYAKHNLTSIPCGSIGAETSGWFKNEIKDISELKGIKMRFFGLGAKVMTKIGVSTQLLAGADIYPALERGVIDATEFSMPNMDIDYGFYQIAKNNYYPGWHQQISIGELLVNKGKHDGLHKAHQMMLDVGCKANMVIEYAETEAKNPAAMMKMKTEYGVTNRRWKDSDLAVLEKAWREVVAEESAKDATFKEFADSYFAFRKIYKIWGDAQSLKSTYLD